MKNVYNDKARVRPFREGRIVCQKTRRGGARSNGPESPVGKAAIDKLRPP